MLSGFPYREEGEERSLIPDLNRHAKLPIN